MRALFIFLAHLLTSFLNTILSYVYVLSIAFRRFSHFFSSKETADFSAASEKEDVYDPADEEEPFDSSAVLVSRLVSSPD